MFSNTASVVLQISSAKSFCLPIKNDITVRTSKADVLIMFNYIHPLARSHYFFVPLHEILYILYIISNYEDISH